MPTYLPNNFVENYARAPSQTVVDRVISLHSNVRAQLGDAAYLTFLQGSYKNDTALADLNDVDIVAVVRAPPRNWVGTPDWEAIFGAIERALQASQHYAGKWQRKDKCIQLNTEYKADIVPAVVREDPAQDPIRIYSWRSRSEKENWPRKHYEAGAAKSAATSGGFKKAVRLFKRHARVHFGARKVAPSYYIETLLHALPNEKFTGNLATDFVALGSAAVAHLDSAGWHKLPRMGVGDDLYSYSEWTSAARAEYLPILRKSVAEAQVALTAGNEAEARAAWRRAFNGHDS